MHPTSEKFHAILREMGDLHDRKAADYGSADDPLLNVRSAEDFGIAPWLGTAIRMNDKVSRLKTFARKGTLRNESVEDSLLDIAVYSIIALILFREEAEQRAADPVSFAATVAEGFAEWASRHGVGDDADRDGSIALGLVPRPVVPDSEDN